MYMANLFALLLVTPKTFISAFILACPCFLFVFKFEYDSAIYNFLIYVGMYIYKQSLKHRLTKKIQIQN